MMSDLLEAVGYIRVSTDDQAENGVSLDDQRKRILSFAAAQNLKLRLPIYEDAGVSAKSLDRPAFAAILEQVRSGAVGAVVVVKLDRLTRSIRDFSGLVEEHFSRPDGPRLMSCSESIDLRKANGRMLAYLLMVFAQYEREVIVERTAGAMDHKRSKGQRLGTIPFGQAVGPDGETLVPHEAELLTLALIHKFRRQGLKFRAIALALDELGVPTRSGRNWATSTVAKLLQSPTDKSEASDAA